MITTIDIAWIAGFLEGEGSFGHHGITPCIQVSNADKDVMMRVASILDTKIEKPRKPKGKPHYKLIYKCVLCGSRAIMWMMTLYLLHGNRRKEAIKKAITTWKNAPGFPRAPKGSRWPAICHPDRLRTGHGLCKSCYMVEWRSKRRNIERAI